MLLILYGRSATRRLPTTPAKVLHGLDALGISLFRPLRTQNYCLSYPLSRTHFFYTSFRCFLSQGTADCNADCKSAVTSFWLFQTSTICAEVIFYTL